MLVFIVKKEQVNQQVFFWKSKSNTWELNSAFLNTNHVFLKRLVYLLNFVNTSSGPLARQIKKNLIFFDVIVSNFCILNNALLFNLQKYSNIHDFNFIGVITNLFLNRRLSGQEDFSAYDSLLNNYDKFLHEKNILLRVLKQYLLDQLKIKPDYFLSTDQLCFNLDLTSRHWIYYEMYSRFLNNLALNLDLKRDFIPTPANSKQGLTLNVYAFILEILSSHLNHKPCLIQSFLLLLDTFRPLVKDLYNVIDRCCIYNLLLDRNICQLSEVDNNVFQKTRTQSQYVFKSAGLKPFTSTEYKFFFQALPLDQAAKFTFPLDVYSELHHLESFYKCSTNVLWRHFQDFLQNLESYFLNLVLMYRFSFK